MRLIIATDELVASLTAELNVQKESVNSSQVKDLEVKGSSRTNPLKKVKSLQEELQRANSALATETSQNAILTARLANRSQGTTAHLREELHSDLTGLIFRNVEHDKGTTIFDCLQIGRNGSIPLLFLN
jgi:Chromosome segregation protein Csm1/Pcs1